MCGRFTLTSTPEALAERFGIEPPMTLTPRYNIAPTQDVLAIRSGEHAARETAWLRWGLIPSWSPDPGVGARRINARVETAAEKRSFRQAFALRRCVVPANGFFEWEDTGAGRQPHWLGLDGGVPFAMAGLWECWQGADGRVLESCTVLTTAATGVVAAIHDRMPLVLSDARMADWLDPTAEPEGVARAAQGEPPAFVAHTVSPRVNHVRHDDPSLVAPAEPQPRQESLF